MWLVFQGPETNYNSASLGRAPLRGQTCQKKSIIEDEPCLDVFHAIAHSEVQDFASWWKDHECQSLSFVYHLALTFLLQSPSSSTELVMRLGEDVEIRTYFYGDIDFSQESRLQTIQYSSGRKQAHVHICTHVLRDYTHTHTLIPFSHIKRFVEHSESLIQAFFHEWVNE